jgi:cytoskeletal protein RodZ
MADIDKSKNELLDEAISLYTKGHLQDAVLKLEALVEKFPDDIELRDTLNTVKAEVHDLDREKAGARPAVPISTSEDIKQNARKRARIAIVILVFLVVLITGLWGLARVLSSYQSRGTNTYHTAEEPTGNPEQQPTVENTTGTTQEAPAPEVGTMPTAPASAGNKGPETTTPATTPPPTKSTEPASATKPTAPASDITPTLPVIPAPTQESEEPQPVGEGYLKISPSPPTTVYVDNVMKGNSQRLGAIKLEEGTHSVTMVSQQYGSRSFTVEIRAGKTTISSFPY